MKKLFLVSVYNDILKDGFGWYDTNIRIEAPKISEVIRQINFNYPWSSSLQIYNVTDDKLYVTSESRKTISKI